MRKFEKFAATELESMKGQLESKADFHYGAMQECKAEGDAEFSNEHRELFESICEVIMGIDEEFSIRVRAKKTHGYGAERLCISHR